MITGKIGGLKVYTDPSKKSKVLASLPKGDELVFTGQRTVSSRWKATMAPDGWTRTWSSATDRGSSPGKRPRLGPFFNSGSGRGNQDNRLIIPTIRVKVARSLGVLHPMVVAATAENARQVETGVPAGVHPVDQHALVLLSPWASEIAVVSGYTVSPI